MEMNIEKIKIKLKDALKPKRYAHSIGVMESGIKLAEKYGADIHEAALAGLLHDCARDLDDDEAFRLCSHYGIEIDEISRQQPELLHGRLGAMLAGDCYEVRSEQVLDAIAVHTMGRPGMALLEKIIFLADYIEPGRNFPEVEEIRLAAEDDLEKALLLAMDSTLKYILKKNRLIHPDTIATRNWLLRICNEK